MLRLYRKVNVSYAMVADGRFNLNRTKITNLNINNNKNWVNKRERCVRKSRPFLDLFT